MLVLEIILGMLAGILVIVGTVYLYRGLICRDFFERFFEQDTEEEDDFLASIRFPAIKVSIISYLLAALFAFLTWWIASTI